MTDPREEVGTKGLHSWENDEMGWTNGQNERRQITKKI